MTFNILVCGNLTMYHFPYMLDWCIIWLSCWSNNCKNKKKTAHKDASQRNWHYLIRKCLQDIVTWKIEQTVVWFYNHVVQVLKLYSWWRYVTCYFNLALMYRFSSLCKSKANHNTSLPQAYGFHSHVLHNYSYIKYNISPPAGSSTTQLQNFTDYLCCVVKYRRLKGHSSRNPTSRNVVYLW